MAACQGVANATWICGAYVVRISKDPEYLSDLLTESVAAPYAYESGLPTPKPLAFSLSTVGDVPPYSVFEFAAGRTLSSCSQMSDAEQFFRLFGAHVRQIHDLSSVVPDPAGHLDDAWYLDTKQILAFADSRGWGKDAQKLIDRVGSVTKCFVHQDLHPSNVLVSPSNGPVWLDWGDAGIGDPAVDLRFVPARFLGSALEGYGTTSAGFVERVALHVLDQYSYSLERGISYGFFGDSTQSDVERVVGQISSRN